MHPQLAQLEQQYLQLVSDLQSGVISQQDAALIIQGMTTIDGEGAIWSIDPYSGEFTRAFAGGVPAPTNPSYFAAAQLPPVNPPIPSHGTPPSGVSEFLHPALQPNPAIPLTQRASASASSVARGTFSTLSKALNPLRGRGRSLMVAAVLLVVAAALVMRSPAMQEADPAVSPATPDLSTAPAVTAAPPPTILIPDNDPDGDPVQAGPVLPDAATLEALMATLISGDQVTLDSILPISAEDRVGLLAVLGAPRAGFTLSWGEVRAAGQAVETSIVVGPVDEPIRTVRLQLGLQGERWVIISIIRQ
jgi:hypothetical protein